MMYKKKGVPIIEVIAPTGSENPLRITLAISSDINKSILPTKKDAIIK